MVRQVSDDLLFLPYRFYCRFFIALAEVQASGVKALKDQLRIISVVEGNIDDFQPGNSFKDLIRTRGKQALKGLRVLLVGLELIRFSVCHLSTRYSS